MSQSTKPVSVFCHTDNQHGKWIFISVLIKDTAMKQEQDVSTQEYYEDFKTKNVFFFKNIVLPWWLRMANTFKGNSQPFVFLLLRTLFLIPWPAFIWVVWIYGNRVFRSLYIDILVLCTAGKNIFLILPFPLIDSPLRCSAQSRMGHQSSQSQHSSMEGRGS